MKVLCGISPLKVTSDYEAKVCTNTKLINKWSPPFIRGNYSQVTNLIQVYSRSDGRLCPKRPHLFDICIANIYTFIQSVGSRVGLSIIRVSWLGHHEGAAVWTNVQAAGTSTAVGTGRQCVADEAASRAGELEDAVGVGVGDEDVAWASVDRNAVRTLELTLAERVACTSSATNTAATCSGFQRRWGANFREFSDNLFKLITV